MSEPVQSERAPSRKRNLWPLLIVFAVAMVFGSGAGLSLAGKTVVTLKNGTSEPLRDVALEVTGYVQKVGALGPGEVKELRTGLPGTLLVDYQQGGKALRWVGMNVGGWGYRVNVTIGSADVQAEVGRWPFGAKPVPKDELGGVEPQPPPGR